MIFRPRRTRAVCIGAAIAVLAMFTLIGTALTGVGDGVFRKGDQVAMIGLGALFAAGIMMVARPKVEADGHGIRVRNIIGGYELPWQVVRAVAFERGQPWLGLELENDETVSVLAVQRVDKHHALAAVQALRQLHAAARGGAVSSAPGGAVTSVAAQETPVALP